RLTNTDITMLEKEKTELEKQIEVCEKILNDPKELLKTIKQSLKQMKKSYNSERRTQIEAEIEELKINIEVTVPSETVLVSRSEEHTSELQSRFELVCRLLLDKKKKKEN